ncbi:5'-methylthioadenosine/S-adenosylhomocysteine nucleosidase [Catellatospora sp. NPDC049111]|uniref:5'-methylthioadenosine/S-adenosylhomocysteine nucleosidase family protein n=1 Tax=Catellatospora sp. NPDC049111 TaxID=3155271 RepID=UPI0033E16416
MPDIPHPTDVVVLTAVDIEYAAVRDLLTGLERITHPRGTVFERGTITGSGVRIGLGMVGMGNRAAAAIAERAIATFRPSAVVFVGIAGARHTDLHLGDIVVGSRIYALHGGKVTESGYENRPRSWDAPHDLFQEANHLLHTRWRDRLPAGRQPADGAKVVFRPIAASDVVVNAATGELAEQVRVLYGDTAAFDMESSGAAEAAQLNQNLPMLVVRGISDRVGESKDASDQHGWREVAAANAAAFAVALIAAHAESQAARPQHQAGPPETGRRPRPRSTPRRVLLALGVVLAALVLPSAYLATGAGDSGVTSSPRPQAATTMPAAASTLAGQGQPVGSGSARPARQSNSASAVVNTATAPTVGPKQSVVVTPPSGGQTARFMLSGHCGPPCDSSADAEYINVYWMVGGDSCLSQQVETRPDGTIEPTALRNEGDGIVEFDGCPPLTLQPGSTYTLRFTLYALKPGMDRTATITIS